MPVRQERVRQPHRRTGEQELTPQLLSLGSTNADFLVRVERLPSGAGTTMGTSVLRTSGGKAANRAVLAARLGAPAVLLSCVGDDDLAEQALAGPRVAGVDLRHLLRRAAPTGYASIAVGPTGDKAITLASGANDAWADDAGAVVQAVRDAPAGSVLAVDLEVPPDLVRRALAAARRRGLTTVLDPAPPGRVDEEVLALADHVVPDEREAEQLTGSAIASVDRAIGAAEALRARGAAWSHVKRSEGGCVTAGPEGLLVTDAPEIDVVDTTGAGDAFAGGLAWALLGGDAVPDAVRTAVAAATCAVAAHGSQEAYPDVVRLRQVRGRVRQRRR